MPQQMISNINQQFKSAKNLKKDPQHLHTLSRKSVALHHLKEYSESISCSNEALKQNKNYCIGYGMKGKSLCQLKKQDDALICYDKAIEIDPNYAYAYYSKGKSLTDLKKYKQAINNYEEAYKQHHLLRQFQTLQETIIKSINSYRYNAVKCFIVCECNNSLINQLMNQKEEIKRTTNTLIASMPMKPSCQEALRWQSS